MIEPHTHNGINSPSIDAKDLTGTAVLTASAAGMTRQVQPTVLEFGTYTLAANVQFVSFPAPYSEVTNLQVLLTSNTNNHSFLQGIAVSGFTVSGSGTDTGRWLSVGFK